MEIDFKGECLGVSLKKRAENDNHILVKIIVEDDGNWFKANSFSSSWLDELINKLEQARDFIHTQEPDIYEGKQYGWKFKEN